MNCKVKAYVMFSVIFSISAAISAGECKECAEVAKGMIPSKFLDKNVKTLPSEIQIWDAPEAIAAINDVSKKIVLIDTRPKSFFSNGSVKNAVNLFYDLKSAATPETEKDIQLTSESLKKVLKASGSDQSLIVFFCQGPECHRSYNAAITSLTDFGFSASQIIWFRDGYPGLLGYIKGDPKLSKKIGKYLQGKDVVE